MHEGPGAAIAAAPGPSAVRIWGPLITLWIVWGTTFLGTSAMVQTMPPLLAAGVRYLLGGLLLAVLMALFRGPRVLRVSRGEFGAAAFAGIGIIGIWGAIVAFALQHIPGGVAALIGATVPLWIVLLRVVAGQRVGWLTWVGVAVGIVGVAAMLLPGGVAPLAGTSTAQATFWSAAMVVASLTYAYFSWRSRTLDLPANTLTSTVYQLVCAGLVIALAGLLTGEHVDSGPYSATSWSGLAWLVIASLIGYGAYTFLIQNAPMSLVSTFAFVNPVVAVILGWLLLGEPFSRSVLIGLVVVVGGTTLVVLGEDRASPG